MAANGARASELKQLGSDLQIFFQTKAYPKAIWSGLELESLKFYRVSQKKRIFRMLLELSRAASGKVTSARFLDKVTLPEAALLSSNSILKVRFFGIPCTSKYQSKSRCGLMASIQKRAK